MNLVAKACEFVFFFYIPYQILEKSIENHLNFLPNPCRILWTSIEFLIKPLGNQSKYPTSFRNLLNHLNSLPNPFKFLKKSIRFLIQSFRNLLENNIIVVRSLSIPSKIHQLFAIFWKSITFLTKPVRNQFNSFPNPLGID